jgi:glycosyltransferase involved in cell wall biosynthesis
MNITVVSDFYYPGNSRGLEEHCRQLQACGHDVHLLAGTFNPQELQDTIEDLPFNVELFPYYNNRTLPLRLAKLGGALRKRWDKIERQAPADYLLFNQPLTALLVEGMTPPYFGFSKPYSYFFHAPWAREWEVHNRDQDEAAGVLDGLSRRFHKTLRRRGERKILHGSEGILTLSQYMQENLLEQHPSLTSHDRSIIPGGVDPDQFQPPEHQSPLRAELGYDSDDQILFTLRRLIPRMGIDRLIRAFHQLDTDGPTGKNTHLIIGGTGPKRESLEDLADQLGCANVHFPGYIPEKQVATYYRVADLFVLPSLKLEGFGYVTLEALASGLPVLATAVGGSREILGPFDEDLLFSGFDPENWASKITKVLGSEKMSEEYSRRCRKYAVENYRWSKIGDQLDEHIQEHAG